MNAVDTNILLYTCDARDSRKQELAQGLVRGLQDPVLLWQVACEFISASRKLRPQGFTAEKAWAQLQSLAESWPLSIPGASMLAAGRGFHLQQGVSFWDSMLYAACLDAGVTRLYSEDRPGSAIPGLEIVNPFT